MFSKCEGHAFLDTKDQFNPSQCMKIHPDQLMTVTFLNTNEYPNNFQQMCVRTGGITYSSPLLLRFCFLQFQLLKVNYGLKILVGNFGNERFLGFKTHSCSEQRDEISRCLACYRSLVSCSAAILVTRSTAEVSLWQPYVQVTLIWLKNGPKEQE